MPDWLVQSAPFDAQQFWITAPPDQNAAPLYVEALYEFSPAMEVFFAPDVRSQRTPTLQSRFERSQRMQIAWNDAQQAKDPSERDAVLLEHEPGWSAIRAAQQRPSSILDFGTDANRMIAVSHAVREVARLGVLKAERELESGNVDGVVRLADTLLRLSRDLRPRAPGPIQDLADAVDAICFENVVLPALALPQLTEQQCGELITLLILHRASFAITQPFQTGLKGTYVWKRLLLHDLQHTTGMFAGSAAATGDAPALTRGQILVASLSDTAGLLGAEKSNPGIGAILDAVLSGMTPTDFEDLHAALTEQYKVLADTADRPYSERSAAFEAWQADVQRETQKQMAPLAALMVAPEDQRPQLAASALDKMRADGTFRGRLLAPLLTGSFENAMASGPPVLSDAVRHTRINGNLALACLRRWQLTHGAERPEMQTMCEDAGLPEPPVDPFADGPLKLATFDAETPIQHPYDQSLAARTGETIVYSVGPDGVDDQARAVWALQPNKLGDLLFRLPATP